MATQQRTFGENIGLEPIVPVSTHPEDPIECADGTVCHRDDVFFAVDGKAYTSEQGRDEAEVEIVKAILGGQEKWVESYTSGEYNNDYGDGYAYVAGEMDYRYAVEQWVEDYDTSLPKPYSKRYDGPYLKRIVDSMTQQIADAGEWDSVFHASEYACYSGDGICIWSAEVGEQEDQIEVCSHAALDYLNDEERLESILEQLDGDFCLHRLSKYNEETEERTYDKFVRHGSFTAIFNPGGQWQYVVSVANAKLYPANAICELCREIDGNK